MSIDVWPAIFNYFFIIYIYNGGLKFKAQTLFRRTMKWTSHFCIEMDLLDNDYKPVQTNMHGLNIHQTLKHYSFPEQLKLFEPVNI